jgi:maleylacetate reductase
MSDDGALVGRILHPPGDGIVYGPGVVARQLAELLSRQGIGRPFVVTTGSVARAGLVDGVLAALGVDAAGVFDGSREHTPAPVVLAAAAMARDAGADGFVSVGGSSVVDLTKGVALVVAEGDERIGPRPAGGWPPAAARPPKHPHIALPTTLSGAEFTAAAGITDTTGHKRAYVDPALAPRWVLLDPELTGATPPDLWAATGMKALADTIEVLCSPRATPMSDAVAVASLAMLDADLARSVADPADMAARGRCQVAVAMTLLQLVGVGVGMVAALRHQLGGALGVPHGVASTIVLPHVVRWNAAVAAGPLARAATALGRTDAAAVVERIEQLIAELDLPHRLRDVGVARDSFPPVAELVLADGALTTNPRPVTGPADVIEVLDAAW